MWTRLTVLLARLHALFSTRRLDAEFDAEIDAHIALLTDDYVRRGLPPDEARRAARVRFGGSTQVKEQRRHSLGFPIIDAVVRDSQYAWRTCRRSPGFSLLAVATLGVGIGVNTTVFTLFDTVALRGLPVAAPETLVRLARAFQDGSRGDRQYAFSYDEYRSLAAGARTVTGLLAASWPVAAAVDGTSLRGQLVSGNYFAELGVVAAAGRLLQPEDERTKQPVIVLSEPAWREHFASDPGVVGRAVRINDASFTAIGVAPATFAGTGNPPRVPDFWTPLTLQPQLVPGSDWFRNAGARPLQLLGRLAAGRTPASAQAELTVLERSIDADTGLRRTILVTPEHATLFAGTTDPRFRAFVGAVMTIVGLVLLIACANLGNMMFARATGRRHELAIRVALGASRARVARQLLTEAVLLSVAGGAAGFLLSQWGCRWVWTTAMEAIQGVTREELPLSLTLAPDTRVFAYTAIVSLVTGALFGSWPAARFSKANVAGALKNEVSLFGRTTSRSRLRDLLVSAQVAGSLVLLASAGLLARGVARSHSVDPGFAANRVFAVFFDRGTDPARALRLQRQVFDRLQSVTGVAAVAYAQRVPLIATWSLPIADADKPDHVEESLANYVSREYFDTIGIPIERGRGFDRYEAAGSAIVSAGAARTMWPASDPIGHRIRMSTSQTRTRDPHDFVVVGVAKDVRSANVSRQDPMYVYLPARETARQEILIRTTDDAAATLESVRAAIGGIDRSLVPTVQLVGFDSLARAQVALTSTIASMATVLAVLALLLASSGIYGVMNLLVAQRVREIGVRMALGASRGVVVRTILADGLRPVAAGAAVGLAVALGTSAILRAILVAPSAPDLLFGVGAFDPLTFLLLCAVLAASAIMASGVPAYRAARVDPMVALRIE
jgi:putative ABC transport system permease protein